MSKESKKLLAGVLKLPAKSRALIAEKLLESLDDHQEVDAAIDESERRWQEFKDGKAKGIPVEAVFPNLARKTKRNGKP
jgi:putative addiction module component (TIGR02574 family)